MTSTCTPRLLRASLFLALFPAATLAQTPSAVTLHVLDSATQKPVADAILTIGTRVLTPDAQGAYNVPSNAPQIMARAPGYRALTTPLSTVTANHNNLLLTPFSVHALYLSEFGISSAPIRDSARAIIQAGGANALVINIKTDHGQLVYPSKIPLAQTIGARHLTTIHSLTDLVTAGHEQGIYMIARIVTFKDDPLATARPDLAAHLPGGALFKDREHLSWTDPFKAEVRAYNIAIAVEAAQAGFDEVQFDYVRFPDASSKLIYSAPTDEPARVKAISSFLADAHTALIPYNTFLSADIFGYTFWNTSDTGIGQQLDSLIHSVDYLCPMLYPSGFKFGIPGHSKPMATTADIHDTIKLTLDNGLKRTNVNPARFRPWLQAFRDYAFGGLVFGADQVSAQIRAADEDHTSGWLLWNPHNRYTGIGLGDAVPEPKPTEPSAPAIKPPPPHPSLDPRSPAVPADSIATPGR